MALVKYREAHTLKEANVERARYFSSVLWMVLLVLFSVLIVGLWGERFPTKSQADTHVSLQASPNNRSPSIAEFVPILSGNPGGSTSLGGGTALGGGR